jgi:hypothetical protein
MVKSYFGSMYEGASLFFFFLGSGFTCIQMMVCTNGFCRFKAHAHARDCLLIVRGGCKDETNICD